MAARSLIVRTTAGLVAAAGVATDGPPAMLAVAVCVGALIASGHPAAIRLALLAAVAAIGVGGPASIFTGPLLLLASEVAFDAPVVDDADRPFVLSRVRSLAVVCIGALIASTACFALAAASARGPALVAVAAVAAGALVLLLAQPTVRRFGVHAEAEPRAAGRTR